MDELLVDENQASEVLHTSPRTLQGWRQRGTGPRYIKVGQLVRYRPSSLQEYISSQTRSSTSEQPA